MDYSELSKEELIKIIDTLNGRLEVHNQRLKKLHTKGYDDHSIDSIETYWKDILDAIPLSVILHDAVGYHWINKYSSNLSGYSNEEWKNMTNEERALIFEFPAKPETLLYMEMMTKQGKDPSKDSIDLEVKLKKKDGQWIWLFTTNSFIYNPQKDDYEYLTTSMDITERKNHELENERLNKELEELIARERKLSKENEDLLKQQISEKDKELNRLAVFLTEKNNCLLKLKKQATTFAKASSKSIKDIASKIITSIDEKLNNESAWTTFEIQFETANPQFSSKLLKLYPNLTVTELRICTLSKLELSSKAIAQILNLSPRTVESHRLSIRKKMKLKNKEQLSVKLNSFL
ncbi:MAG: LuxR C-terminal-related transcriptional regulator [bacterium]